MKSYLLLLCALWCGALYAQPVPGIPATTNARTGGAVLFGEDGDWLSVNPAALDDTVNFTPETVGIGKPITLYPVVDFESELNWRGKKLATQTFIPKLGTESYLFGGEAYLDLNCLLPVDSAYAKGMNIYMGWCYQLTRYIDVDVGGNLFFYDKQVYGFGQTGPGTKDSGDFHLGLSADVPLNPWAWVTYDFVYDALIFEGGLIHRQALQPWVGVENLSLELGVTSGWLQSNRYSGRTKINGQYWENSYGYVFTSADLVYRPLDPLAVSVGVRWSGNNDGSGYAANGMWIGPDSSVWFGMSVTYTLGL